MNDEEPIEIPINGELDLHTFRPSDIKPLLNDYIDACREKGICELRIIHGKGMGTLRETVHAQLRKNPFVTDFKLGNEASGGWGATRVTIR